jgi:hypothetical protein
VRVETNYTVTPIWNVIGRIEGKEEPDRFILLGAHRGTSIAHRSVFVPSSMSWYVISPDQ